jgi:hypothetical protein
MGNTFSLRRPGFFSSSHSSSPFLSESDSKRLWKPPQSDSEAGTVCAILYADGSCYYGPESEGKSEGFGIVICNDGSEIEGYWEDGLLDGNALTIRSDGAELFRTYKRGEITTEFKVTSANVYTRPRRMVRAISGLARGTKSSSSSRSSMTPSSSSEDLYRMSKDISFGARTRMMAASCTPPQMFASTGSSTARIYVPRPPSMVDTWLIPFDQLVFESRVSKHKCPHCSIVYTGSWLGKEVMIRVFTNTIDDDRCRILLCKMAKIRHPNIALFMAAAVSPTENKLAIVTEFIMNRGLDTLMRPPSEKNPGSTTQSLTAQNVLHLAKGIAVGCAYLRKCGFAHKNLKPSNVMIDSSIDIKLTDYFVKEFNEIFHPLPCFADHNVSYIAPEALRLTPFIPYGIDTASDVYSFGMLCWEMVTGREPYRGLSRAQIRVLVGYGGYRESRIQGGTLRGLSKLIEKCTLQEPQERPTFERILVAINSMHSSANSAAEDALITFISGR